MTKARMTTKGQLTIPKRVREALRLETGVEVEFTLTADGAAILRRRHLVDALCGEGHHDGPPVPVAAIPATGPATPGSSPAPS
jgi:AbrB family looped-hinge helix DNA binding protein